MRRPSPARSPLPRSRRALCIVGTSAAALLAGACGTGAGAASTGSEPAAAPKTVTVETNTGPVQVPASPQRVVALDNTSFETLQAFGITPVAAPKQLLPKELNTWAQNTSILDIGTHREPKLEVVAQAKPDLIIGGKRFAKVTGDLQKIAPVIDIAPSTEKPGYVDALKKQTTALGEIFGKQDQATQLTSKLDEAVASAAAATADGKKAFLANHNGGKIDNAAGRIGVLLQPLKLTDVFATKADSESIHQDSGLSPETIAQAAPDVMIVMDRDAAVAKKGDSPVPARRTIEAQKAWANTPFVKNDAIIYLADNFYVTEGVQAYTDAYTKIAQKLQAPAR